MERRFVKTDRASVDGMRLRGHASVFNEETRIRDFWELVHPGAFDRALRENQDVVLLANHDGLPIGATYAGTLRLGVDDRGLAIDADLPETTLGRDVAELTRRGDLRAMSFGFVVREDEWTTRDDGSQLRTLLDLDLFDASVVTFPAYAGTDLALRYAGELPTPPATRPRVTARGQHALIRARLKG